MRDPDPLVTAALVDGTPRRTGRFWFDFAAASAAIFISVVSLVIGMRGETIQKELLAANSWPFLEVNEERNPTTADLIEVRNEGVGPAIVSSFEVFFRGLPVVDGPDLLRRCCEVSADAGKTQTEMFHDIGLGDVAGNVIRPDQARTMIRLGRPKDAPDLFDKFDAQLGNITFRVCYCSILDRCWMTDLRSLKPTVIASCPIPPHPFRYNFSRSVP